MAECVTLADRLGVKKEIKQMNELDFETSFEPIVDASASLKEVERLQKIRHLDCSIGDTLKKLYDYRCQMTGERIGEEHGAFVVTLHLILSMVDALD